VAKSLEERGGAGESSGWRRRNPRPLEERQMCEKPVRSRPIALVALAGALAWSPPSFGVEAESQLAATPPGERGYHTLEPGETLSAIAERYGTSIADLIRENDIDDPNDLWVGARLHIPTSAARQPTTGDRAAVNAEAPEPTEIAALLDRCEAELRAARFEQALASAGEARDRIDARAGARDDPGRVRLEIVSATALVALGRKDAALEALERALVADPDLELDPALTSPKVLAVFRAARGRAPAPD
jgi:LysM repeat protein